MKELSRRVSDPKEADIPKLKRCLKYLKGTKNVAFSLCALKEECKDGDVIQVWVDADWTSPKSTSGWVVLWNGVVMQAVSRTQATPALSSAEAEIMAANEAAKEATWLQHILEEVEGRSIKIRLYCDASAAIGFMKR